MKPNRLARETSPYLKQHALNPVDWYPWGSEALDRARREGKPIFLSIGYSACHWCHVMERESFEDAATAEILNRDFISIKVDREERPDLDHIYMAAVQAMTGHGGWPLNVFLTPDQKPFYGGTYFPPDDRHGIPAFKKILQGVGQAWKSRREEVLQNSQQLLEALAELHQPAGKTVPESLSWEIIDDAMGAFAKSFDSAFGGLGTAPKFFHSMAFRFSLRQWKRTQDPLPLKMVTYTLDQIARGGIRDQLAGGFHRYSTDAHWLAPHFEKMLYDNALLAELFLEAFQATQDTRWAETARSTLDYLQREMLSPEAIFFSTEDADSEGVEGKFYVWSEKEIVGILGAELGPLFCAFYGVTAEGNWEETNILHQVEALDRFAQKQGQDAVWVEEQLALGRRKLLEKRAERVRPGRDEKALLSWNGLALSAFAVAHQVLDDENYLQTAQKLADSLLHHFTAPHALPSGKRRLFHSRKDGVTRFNGCLDDYAYFLKGLVDLYESDFDPRWLESAYEITQSMLEQFWEPQEQVFYYTGQDHEKLVNRPREYQDGATPAGQSIAVTALLKLARLCHMPEWEDIALASLQAAAPLMRQIPTGVAQMLIAAQTALGTAQEAVLIPGSDADATAEALRHLRRKFSPGRLVLVARANTPEWLTPWFEGRTAQGGEPTLYLCEQNTCAAPARGLAEIQAALGGAGA